MATFFKHCLSIKALQVSKDELGAANIRGHGTGVLREGANGVADQATRYYSVPADADTPPFPILGLRFHVPNGTTRALARHTLEGVPLADALTAEAATMDTTNFVVGSPNYSSSILYWDRPSELQPSQRGQRTWYLSLQCAAHAITSYAATVRIVSKDDPTGVWEWLFPATSPLLVGVREYAMVPISDARAHGEFIIIIEWYRVGALLEDRARQMAAGPKMPTLFIEPSPVAMHEIVSCSADNTVVSKDKCKAGVHRSMEQLTSRTGQFSLSAEYMRSRNQRRPPTPPPRRYTAPGPLPEGYLRTPVSLHGPSIDELFAAHAPTDRDAFCPRLPPMAAVAAASEPDHSGQRPSDLHEQGSSGQMAQRRNPWL